MTNNFIFSLVVATVNRKSELERFLNSISSQIFDLNLVEILIVDQNKNNLIDNILLKYKKIIPHLSVYKVDFVGVSKARNLGLQFAKGKFFAFPDDDCEYFPETLNDVNFIFNSNEKIDFLLGSIRDKTKRKKLIRKWPDTIKKINLNNFFYLYSMITFFTTKKIIFDERFGGGGKFHAYEDADLVLEHLNQGYMGIYTPKIKIYHPELNIGSMDSVKIFNYGIGFGAFCRKNISFSIFIIYFFTVSYHFLMFIVQFCFLSKDKFEKRKKAFLSRLNGWVMFGKK